MSLIPTVALRIELRWLIDERILGSMTAADTRFSDVDLDVLLTGATHINAAASSGWRIKASRAMSERGGLEVSHAGDEKHTFVNLADYRDHCLAMAQMYAQMIPRTGSRTMQYDLPEVSRRRG